MRTIDELKFGKTIDELKFVKTSGELKFALQQRPVERKLGGALPLNVVKKFG